MSPRPRAESAIRELVRILRVFRPWLREQRRRIGTTTLAMFGGVVFSLLEPWPLKLVLDLVVPTTRPVPRTVPDWIAGIEISTLLPLLAAATVLLSALVASCEYLAKVGFARIGNDVLRGVRDHLFLHVQRLSMSFHVQARAGDLVTRATRDVSLVRDVMSTALLPLCANVLVLAGMLAVMAWLQWQLTLIALATLPLFLWTTASLGGRIHRAAKQQRKREGAMASTATESIAAIKVVQALSLEEAFADGFASRNAASQKEDQKAARLSANLGRNIDVLLAVATALVLWQGARFVLDARMSAGDLVVFLTYLRRSFRPAKDFAKYTGRIAKAIAAGERVAALLERAPDVRDLPDACPAPPFRGEVAFESVTFGYGDGRDVLREIDLHVEAGSLVAVVGPSGIGKSTLASLLLRFWDPLRGVVSIDGIDLRRCTLRSLRRQISVVLQETVLFAGSIRENLAHGIADATDERIEAAARLARCHEFIAAMPDGYDTVVGERGSTLSHGQRQRLAIARAAMRDTPLLVLDEPTSGLDEATRRDVVGALLTLAAGRTTFLVTHELDLTDHADLVVCIDGGRIVESGPPAQLLEAQGVYARLRGTHAPREVRDALSS